MNISALDMNSDFDILPEAHTPTRRSPNLWDPRLPLDLAMNLDLLPDILARYELTEAAFARLSDTPAFRRELALAMKDVRDNGLAYSAKCRVQAESYLERIDQLIFALDTPSGVVLDAIKWVAKMGNLEPRETKEAISATQVNVNINF